MFKPYEEKTGTIIKVNDGKFGFIALENNEAELFVMPSSCAAFGDAIPPVGTEVVLEVVLDEKTGRPRAGNVRPKEGTSAEITAIEMASELASLPAEATPQEPGTDLTGVVIKDNGTFGFIKQDSHEENMFVMPKACEAFGGVVPPIGTRVVYDVVVDDRTSRPRADNVRFEGTPVKLIGKGKSGSAIVPHQGGKGKPDWSYGFEQGFEASWSSTSWGQPSKGGKDSKKGYQGSRHSGTFIKDNGSFGFIQQDSGQENMFAMPKTCVGGSFPPVGTRVSYDVVIDDKTGRPRAEQVIPEEFYSWQDSNSLDFTAAPPVSQSTLCTGSILQINNEGMFGFIQQDDGGPNMFVMPNSCIAFDSIIPPVGTRVMYRVIIDGKTGRPRAEDVVPEGAGAWGAQPAVADHSSYGSTASWSAPSQQNSRPPMNTKGQPQFAGAIEGINGGFGFIKQDVGGDNMFVMPKACAAFGNQIPPIGTRVWYSVVKDAKTGRPRADDVVPEGQWPAPISVGKGGCPGGKGGKGKGKGKKGRSSPY